MGVTVVRRPSPTAVTPGAMAGRPIGAFHAPLRVVGQVGRAVGGGGRAPAPPRDGAGDDLSPAKSTCARRPTDGRHPAGAVDRPARPHRPAASDGSAAGGFAPNPEGEVDPAAKRMARATPPPSVDHRPSAGGIAPPTGARARPTSGRPAEGPTACASDPTRTAGSSGSARASAKAVFCPAKTVPRPGPRSDGRPSTSTEARSGPRAKHARTKDFGPARAPPLPRPAPASAPCGRDRPAHRSGRPPDKRRPGERPADRLRVRPGPGRDLAWTGPRLGDGADPRRHERPAPRPRFGDGARLRQRRAPKRRTREVGAPQGVRPAPPPAPTSAPGRR